MLGTVPSKTFVILIVTDLKKYKQAKLSVFPIEIVNGLN